MIRAALIGVSGFGSVHYGDLLREAQAGRIQPVAATVTNPDEEKDKCAALRGLGVELFADYREMLARFRGSLDLCLIPTGIHQHAPMTLAALAAGANVLVEKPAAATVAEVRAMRAAARAAGRFVAVAFQNMYSDDTHAVKRLLHEGCIGPVRAVTCRGLWPRADSYYARNRWAGRLRLDDRWVLDSPFNNALAHYLMLSLFFAGRDAAAAAQPKTVRAELYRARPIESCDTACLRVQTEEGVPVQFIVTHCCREAVNPAIRVVGAEGTLTWNTDGPVRIERSGAAVETVPGPDHAVLRPRMWDALVRRWQDPSAFLCTLDLAGLHTLVVNGAHVSSEIHTIPAAETDRHTADGDDWITIRDIERISARAAAEGKLFSELGVPWARPGREVSAAEAATLA